MWRVLTGTFAALTLFSTVAAAQQPCTSNANRVMTEIYRNILDRGVDQAAQPWVQKLANGEVTVKELVRGLANSPEYAQKFGQTRIFSGQTHQRVVADLYRRLLNREADAAGLQSWTRTAQQRGIGAVVDGLLDSQEYNSNVGDWGVPGAAGMRFCANGGGGQVSDASVAPRFRGMDRNSDGVVTRAEWNGTTVAFNNQDVNGDGVLSGAELSAGGGRRGGRRAADHDFDALDVNGNNRVERREWLARLDEFNRLDVDGNNVLSRAEVEGVGAVGTAGRTIPVGGDRQWMDSGINVRAGDMIAISAQGQIRLSRNNRDVATAAGSTQDRRIAASTIPSAPAGILVMRIGETAPVVVGESRTIRASRAGRLFFGVNDDYFDDNTGEFNVTVNVN